MFQHAARLRAVLVEGRAVFVAGQPHANSLLCHGDGRIADQPVKAEAGDVEHVLRREPHDGFSAQRVRV